MRYVFILIIAIFFNCKGLNAQNVSAQEIINRSIEVSGANKVGSSEIIFDFRKVHYSATRKDGMFELKRTFQQDSKEIQDKLSNNGFKRMINKKLTELSETMKARLSASVNSVHYFSVLPYGLNANAVKKNYLIKTKIKDSLYYAIKVTFAEEGGGEDFEDVFIYWVNEDTFKINYIAYSYEEASGQGMRFREAYNERYVNGIRFVDYNNYKPRSNSVKLLDLANLFELNELEMVSKIELKNVVVNPLE